MRFQHNYLHRTAARKRLFVAVNQFSECERFTSKLSTIWKKIKNGWYTLEIINRFRNTSVENLKSRQDMSVLNDADLGLIVDGVCLHFSPMFSWKTMDFYRNSRFEHKNDYNRECPRWMRLVNHRSVVETSKFALESIPHRNYCESVECNVGYSACCATQMH